MTDPKAHPEGCQRCGRTPAEDIPLQGYTERLCEPCARVAAPYLFPEEAP